MVWQFRKKGWGDGPTLRYLTSILFYHSGFHMKAPPILAPTSAVSSVSPWVNQNVPRAESSQTGFVVVADGFIRTPPFISIFCFGSVVPIPTLPPLFTTNLSALLLILVPVTMESLEGTDDADTEPSTKASKSAAD